MPIPMTPETGIIIAIVLVFCLIIIFILAACKILDRFACVVCGRIDKKEDMIGFDVNHNVYVPSALSGRVTSQKYHKSDGLICKCCLTSILINFKDTRK